MKRRRFLQGTGAGLLILSNSRSVWTYQANERLNVAGIGVGGQGTGLMAHAGARGHNIVALCDVDDQRGSESFQRFPQAKRYRDFRKLYDEMAHSIDAVIVATPDHTHAVASAPALRLGKHVYCEKPLTRTVYESRLLRQLASKKKLVTQMGNQGTASEGFRRAVELAWAGVIGRVSEAHAWFGGGNGPSDRPSETPPVPNYLEWDLWIGPAPYRPYHPAYHPGGWRSWRDFGSGAFGDFACHTMNLAFMALRLDSLWKEEGGKKRPRDRLIRVEGKASEIHPETYSRWNIIRYQFPARGSLPPVTLTWYNGGPKPPQDLFLDHPVTDNGCLLVGTKGSILSPDPWNTWFVLLPKKQFEGFQGPEPTLPRPPGHMDEWLDACRGKGRCFSPFDYGGPLTETVQLGNAAVLVGHPLEYDPVEGNIVNCTEANRYLHREYRRGWTL